MAAANDTNFDEVEVRVREMVPEYGRIYKECNDLIQTVKDCFDSREQSERCAQAEEDLARCTNQAICPAEFMRAMSCLGNDPESRVTECMPDIQGLKLCADTVGQKVYNAVVEVVKEMDAKKSA